MVKKAIKEAKMFGETDVVASSEIKISHIFLRAMLFLLMLIIFI